MAELTPRPITLPRRFKLLNKALALQEARLRYKTPDWEAAEREVLRNLEDPLTVQVWLRVILEHYGRTYPVTGAHWIEHADHYGWCIATHTEPALLLTHFTQPQISPGVVYPSDRFAIVPDLVRHYHPLRALKHVLVHINQEQK